MSDKGDEGEDENYDDSYDAFVEEKNMMVLVMTMMTMMTMRTMMTKMTMTITITSSTLPWKFSLQASCCVRGNASNSSLIIIIM